MRENTKKGLLSIVLHSMVMTAAAMTLGILIFILAYILVRGVPYLKPSLFALEYTSENVSLLPALLNTLFLTFLSLLAAIPVGVGASVYLVEYAKKGSKIISLIGIATETLAGIPSIVYGLFGMLFFVKALGMGLSILAGSLTMTIMVLPLIMKTTEEALKSVPDSFREGSFGLGAGKLRTIVKVILPAAMPGILSGVILAIGRIVGETAALMYTAGTVSGVAQGLFGSGRTLAYHMYYLSSEGFHTNEAFATAVVLLIIVLGVNGMSSFVAKKIGKSW